MRLIRRLFLIAALCVPLFMLSQDESEQERGYDQTELADLNESKSFDYSREIPPPKNFLLDFLNALMRAIVWLFSNVIGYLILIGLLALLVWIIIKNTSNAKSGRLNTKDIDPLIEVHSAEQLANEDFDSLIQSALTNGDFRAAVRFTFLKSLKILQLAKHIDWQIEKTNYDYLREVPETQQSDFRGVLHVYEYVWYGEFEATEPIFNRLNNSVKSLEGRTRE